MRVDSHVLLHRSFFHVRGDPRDLLSVRRRQRQVDIGPSVFDGEPPAEYERPRLIRGVAVDSGAKVEYDRLARPDLAVATAGAASYTYLRAHETSAHLVCRFFFEQNYLLSYSVPCAVLLCVLVSLSYVVLMGYIHM